MKVLQWKVIQRFQYYSSQPMNSLVCALFWMLFLARQADSYIILDSVTLHEEHALHDLTGEFYEHLNASVSNLNAELFVVGLANLNDFHVNFSEPLDMAIPEDTALLLESSYEIIWNTTGVHCEFEEEEEDERDEALELGITLYIYIYMRERERERERESFDYLNVFI